MPMHPRRFRPVITLALAALAGGSALPGSALACGGEWYPEVQEDPRIRGVDRAEDAFEQGRILAAAGSVIRMMPHIRTLSPTRTRLVQRAERILAVAIARNDGALAVTREVPDYAQGGWVGRTEAERAANLEWAGKTLRAIAATHHDDPASRTELAEALARRPATRGEARAILEELAARDLVTSPEGYATLARLRDGDGDAAGKQAALERCRAMRRDGAACDVAT